MSEPVSATLDKPTQDTRVGLKLGVCDGGGAQITRLSKKGGIFSNSLLKPGMKLTKINSQDCSYKTPSEITAILRGVIGPLTIEAIWPDESSSEEESSSESEEEIIVEDEKPVARMMGTFSENGVEEASEPPVADDVFVVSGIKNTKHHKVGLRLSREKATDLIMVESLSDTSIFNGTDLSAGMRILSINGVSSLGKTVTEMSKVIAAAERNVRIKACYPTEGENNAAEDDGEITAVARKRSVDQKVGMRLTRSKDVIAVESISETSLFHESGLVAGMEVLTINGISTQGKTVKDMSKIIAQSIDRVEIRARREGFPFVPKPPSSVDDTASNASQGIAVVTARKSSKDQKVGLRLHKTEDRVVIEKLTPTSLFSGTALEVGMQVLSVNGISTRDKSVKDISYIIMQAEGPLEVRACHRDHLPEEYVERPPPSPKGLHNVAPPPQETPDAETVVAQRPPGQKVGVRLTRGSSGIQVAKISDESIFAGTTLAVGMEILSVNGVSSRGKSVKDFSMIMGETMGQLKLAVRQGHPPTPHATPVAMPAVAAPKPAPVHRPPSPRPVDSGRIVPPGAFVTEGVKGSPDTKVGLRLSRSQDQRDVIVSKVSAGSIFFGKLAPGMTIISINNVMAANSSVKELSQVAVSAERRVVVVAKKPKPESAYVNVPNVMSQNPRAPRSTKIGSNTWEYEMYKDGNTKLGLRIKDDPDDSSKIIVTSVTSSGLFAQTNARAGMHVKSFNGSPVGGRVSANDLSNLLRNTSGTFKLEMDEPIGELEA